MTAFETNALTSIERAVFARPDDPKVVTAIDAVLASHPFSPKDFPARFRLHAVRAFDGECYDLDVLADISEALVDDELSARAVSGHLAPAHDLVIDERLPLIADHVEPDVARTLFTHCHYIRSERERSETIGVRVGTPKGPLLAAACLSPCDLSHVVRRLPGGVTLDDACVISRVYAFDFAPKNTLTRVLSQAIRHAEARNKCLFLTYVNPNLGFTGISYRAANFFRLGFEPGVRYQYVDGLYQTDRQICRKFGVADPTDLRKMLGSRYDTVNECLKPLELYAYTSNRGLRRAFQDWRPQLFPRD